MAAKKQTAEDQRQSFIDQTAIALFANGWPKHKIYEHASSLWKLREEHLAIHTPCPETKKTSE